MVAPNSLLLCRVLSPFLSLHWGRAGRFFVSVDFLPDAVWINLVLPSRDTPPFSSLLRVLRFSFLILVLAFSLSID